MANIQPKFSDKTLADSNWLAVTDFLPSKVSALELRNITAALQVRNSEEPTKLDDYAQDEIYLLEPRTGAVYNIENLEIKGAAANVIRAEYQL